jgi:hypothetical protein
MDFGFDISRAISLLKPETRVWNPCFSAFTFIMWRNKSQTGSATSSIVVIDLWSRNSGYVTSNFRWEPDMPQNQQLLLPLSSSCIFRALSRGRGTILLCRPTLLVALRFGNSRIVLFLKCGNIAESPGRLQLTTSQHHIKDRFGLQQPAQWHSHL